MRVNFFYRFAAIFERSEETIPSLLSPFVTKN